MCLLIHDLFHRKTFNSIVIFSRSRTLYCNQHLVNFYSGFIWNSFEAFWTVINWNSRLPDCSSFDHESLMEFFECIHAELDSRQEEWNLILAKLNGVSWSSELFWWVQGCPKLGWALGKIPNVFRSGNTILHYFNLWFQITFFIHQITSEWIKLLCFLR